MEITPATDEQIAIFKKAAAARYAERGIPAAKAEELFEATMGKLASSLGIGGDKAADCDKAPKSMKPKKSKKVEKIASAIATSIGRERK